MQKICLVNSELSSFVQVSLNVERKHAEHATVILESSGAVSVSIASANDQECFDEAAPGEPEWDHQRISALFDRKQSIDSIAAALSMSLNSAPELVVEYIEDKDWEYSWRDGLKPIRVGKRLWVCPSWCEPVEESAINVTIDPGQAFGTGTHETTQLCLAYLASEHLDGKTVLDFGCGSGILGIAAIKLGAKSAIGVDIDPRAIHASVQNAKINQVQKKFCVLSSEEFELNFGNFKADLVIANILEQSIIALSTQIAAMVTTGGSILLSGILEHQVESVVQAFGPGIQFSQEVKNGWMLLIGHCQARTPDINEGEL